MVQDIIVFGSVPLAEKVIWHLHGLRETNIVGVVTIDRDLPSWRSTSSDAPVVDACDELDIPIIDKKSIVDLKPDIGFTVRYPEILPKEILESFDYGVINFHGGHLPEYRGVHAANHALLNNEQWHGATLHFCDPGIDTGSIIARQKFEIEEKDTCYTLFQKSKITLWNLYVNNIDDIVMRNNKFVSQSSLEVYSEPTTYYRDDIENKKQVDLNSDSDDLLRRIRAFDFPTHKPAYTKVGNKEIHLRTGWNDGWPEDYDVPSIGNK